MLDMDPSAYERPPQNLDPSAKEVIRGVYKMKDGLLLVLDTEKAIEVSSCHAPQNGHVDSHSLQATPAAMGPASPVVASMHAQPAKTAELQSQAKKGIKNNAVNKTNGAARGVQAESG